VTSSVFAAYYQDPRFKPSLIQKELVDGGFLGRKTGRGFYDYREGAAKPEPHTATPCEAPQEVLLFGNAGIAGPLVEAMRAAGIAVNPAPESDDGLLLSAGRARIALTDGRTATERCAEGASDLVLLDLALDFADCARVALAAADQTAPAALEDAIGLMQAIGKQVSVIDDAPGMIVMRTVAMLANEGADAVHQQVCDAAAVDTAMRGGVNYPRGPMSWADAIGPDRVLDVLDNLAVHYGDGRYRASPLLQRVVARDGNFIEAEEE
jgi:3-hydroxybutyryl-CoA dehydrogenase